MYFKLGIRRNLLRTYPSLGGESKYICNKNSLNLDYKPETPQITGISVRIVKVVHHNGKWRTVLSLHYFTILWIFAYNFTKVARLKLSFITTNLWDSSPEIYFHVDSSTRKSIRTIEKLEHDKL